MPRPSIAYLAADIEQGLHRGLCSPSLPETAAPEPAVLKFDRNPLLFVCKAALGSLRGLWAALPTAPRAESLSDPTAVPGVDLPTKTTSRANGINQLVLPLTSRRCPRPPHTGATPASLLRRSWPIRHHTTPGQPHTLHHPTATHRTHLTSLPASCQLERSIRRRPPREISCDWNLLPRSGGSAKRPRRSAAWGVVSRRPPQTPPGRPCSVPTLLYYRARAKIPIQSIQRRLPNRLAVPQNCDSARLNRCRGPSSPPPGGFAAIDRSLTPLS